MTETSFYDGPLNTVDTSELYQLLQDSMHGGSTLGESERVIPYSDNMGHGTEYEWEWNLSGFQGRIPGQRYTDESLFVRARGLDTRNQKNLLQYLRDTLSDPTGRSSYVQYAFYQTPNSVEVDPIPQDIDPPNHENWPIIPIPPRTEDHPISVPIDSYYDNPGFGFGTYGNYVGPNWSAGTAIDKHTGFASIDWSKAPVDRLDALARDHDMCYFSKDENHCDWNMFAEAINHRDQISTWQWTVIAAILLKYGLAVQWFDKDKDVPAPRLVGVEPNPGPQKKVKGKVKGAIRKVKEEVTKAIRNAKKSKHTKGKKKRGSGGKTSGNYHGSVAATYAMPTTYATKAQTGKVTVTRRSGGIRVSGTETITDINSLGNKFGITYSGAINPGNSTMFTELFNESRNYEFYNFRYLMFEYWGSGNQVIQGRIGAAFDYDAKDSPPASWAALTNKEGAVSGNTFLNIRVPMNIRNTKFINKYKVRSPDDSPAGVDDTYDCAMFYLASNRVTTIGSDGSTPAYNGYIGELKVSYVCDLDVVHDVSNMLGVTPTVGQFNGSGFASINTYPMGGTASYVAWSTLLKSSTISFDPQNSLINVYRPGRIVVVARYFDNDATNTSGVGLILNTSTRATTVTDFVTASTNMIGPLYSTVNAHGSVSVRLFDISADASPVTPGVIYVQGSGCTTNTVSPVRFEIAVYPWVNNLAVTKNPYWKPDSQGKNLGPIIEEVKDEYPESVSRASEQFLEISDDVGELKRQVNQLLTILGTTHK